SGLRPEEVQKGPLHLLAHELRVLSCDAKRRAVLSREGRARELAQELRHTLAIGRGDVLGHARLEGAPAGLERRALPDPERSAPRLCEEVERRADAQRVAAPLPDGERLSPCTDAADELGGEA